MSGSLCFFNYNNKLVSYKINCERNSVIFLMKYNIKKKLIKTHIKHFKIHFSTTKQYNKLQSNNQFKKSSQKQQPIIHISPDILNIYIYKNELLFVSLAKTREWLNGFILSWS